MSSPQASNVDAIAGMRKFRGASTDISQTVDLQPQKEPVRISNTAELNFGLRWDFVGDEPIDLDASCVSFDVVGNPGEVVFFNNLVTRGEWMLHTGDNRTGEGEEDDEAIQVFFEKVPQTVAQMILVVTCHQVSQNLASVKSVVCVVTDMVTGELFCPEMDVILSKDHTAIILCALCRCADGTDWELRELMVPAEGHSVGETRLLQKMQDQLRIPPELQQRRKKLVIDYDVKKGDVAIVPLDLSHIMMGLGWTKEDSDLDASCIMLDKDGWYRDHVSAKKKHRSNDDACQHSGDNAFDGQGDKENIHVKLDSVHPDVHFIMFTVSHVAREHDVWNSGRLGATQGAYCRLTHITKKKMGKGHTHNLDDRKEICRVPIMKLPRDASALVFACVYRDLSRPGGWWVKKISETLSQVLRGSNLPGELLPTLRCLSYYLKDRNDTWTRSPEFRAFVQRRCMMQLTIVEAKGLSPQDAEFKCHCQAWIMDRERNQRQKTSGASDRQNPTWGESLDFKVGALDAVRVMCFEWGSVGVVDIPLGAALPDHGNQCYFDLMQEPGGVDQWFPLQGHNIEGELRVKLVQSSAPLTNDDEDEDSAVCCSVM
eukprot:TRINITY_DN7682_c0_g3_i2.p1 TRINITY_DN7682_c0_g3~~TRINITY_DN7682_c0_g3_i2.p1  ORF type:complete len:626 (+),score=135.90 TRINITY_DN7682_c0_g3_i2:83-1879(+)